MVVVMMMWCALNVVMVVYLLAWAALWDTRLSSVDCSGSREGRIVVGLVVMVMVVMVTVKVSIWKDPSRRGGLTDGVAHDGGGVQYGYACSVLHHARRTGFPFHHYYRHRTHPRP